MNKNHYAALAATIVTFGLPATAVQAQSPINVTVDGDVITFAGQQPVEQFGSVLVPLRGVFEKLGATVAYDGGSKTILAVRGATTVSLQLESTQAKVNDSPRTLSVPARAVNGSTLVPLRFVSEALGAQVQWQPTSRTVIVSSTGGGDASVPPVPPRPTPPMGKGPGKGARDDRFTYGRITFDWEWNGFSVSDRANLEAQIRRELSANAGSRFVGRRENSQGSLDVNVTLKRLNANNVQADVRLGLNQDGRGGASVNVTESATARSRINNVPKEAVMEAFRNARREFGVKVNEYARRDR